MNIDAWVAENVEYQSDDFLSKAGLDYDEIISVLQYMATNNYIPWETYTEWDVSRLLKELSFTYHGTKEAYASSVLSEREERVPFGVQVDWDTTADFYLTDEPHYEFENGAVAVWNDN